MDKKLEILLGAEKNINSVNVDNYSKVELLTKTSKIREFDLNDVVNSTDVFDAEREENEVYRIYGRIEWLSLLNGLDEFYDNISDFFNPTYTEYSKNLINSFDFYLIAPSSGATYGNISGTNNKRRNFQVIATPDEFEIYNAGFSNNVYGEQVYTFNFKTDIDISGYYDNLGFPLTQLFLYPQYKIVDDEKLLRLKFLTSGTILQSILTTKDLEIGDIVEDFNGNDIQDIIEYLEDDYYQQQVTEQKYYIKTSIYYQGQQKKLVWSYNPFIPLRLRYFENVVNKANTGSTSYDVVNSIPDYATAIDSDGNYVWRNILPQGSVDPLTGIGVDYPFINKRRYLFTPIVFTTPPNLTEESYEDDADNVFTIARFEEISYTDNATDTDTTPATSDDLDNIEKPCQ